jgi:hypothetical protein
MTHTEPHHYEATAVRDGRWWLIQVPGIGATQSRTLGQAEEQARDLIAAVLDVDIEDVRVDVLPDLGERLLSEVRDVRRCVDEATEALRLAAERNRDLAAHLVHDCKLSGTDAAVVLGVSPQRVSQLIKEAETAKR